MLNQRHLWNVLSGVEATPDDYIGHLIETAKPQLIAVLEKSKFDSLTVESGRSKLQKDGTSDLALAFIQRLAEHLNISLLSASDVFGSYLLSNFISADECIAKLEGDVRRKKTLIDQVAEFYRLEQLYSIRCLIELIKNSDREEASFVKEAVFFGKILAHVEAVITGSAFPTFGSSNATDEALSVWAAHCAQLQMLLFELILWHLHLLPHSAADCISIIKLFKKYEHGRKQPMRRYNAAGFDLATPSITHLQTLAVLRCFDMDALVAQSLADLDIARSTERHTWSVASDWNALETELGTWSRSSELSPILLAWAVMLKLLDRPDQDVKVQKLGALARKFDACAWLRSGIEDSLIKNNPDLKRLSMTIVYCLLDAFLCCFEADSLCPADSLNGILATLLYDASLADDVWSRHFSSGVSRHIRDTLYRFPCYFDGPVELLTSLCRASSSSAQKAVTLLQRLPYYAESAVTAASDLEDAGTDDDGLYRSTQTRHMPDGTVIPARTIGQVIDDAAGQLIQWRLYTNGWQICLSEAKRQNANIVLDLVTAAIKSDVTQTDKFAHLLNVAVEIYERDDSHSSIANMSACMRCFAAVAASHCAEMLNELEQAQVLPHATPGNDAVDGGVVGRLLVANEIPSNTFDHTVAFLEFVHSCTTSVDVRDHPTFVGCVLFVLRSVFPVYHQWDYADPNQKDLIGNLSLQVIHSLVQRKEGGLSDSSAACINELMCGEARSTLILLSTVGADVLDYLAKNSAPSVSTEAAKTVVRALSVLSQLLDQPNSNDTPLIADLFVSNVELTRQPVGLIASYLSFAADGRLAKLALVVLRKLATLCPGTMLSCLGARASSVASAFISRLESPLEDVQLKVYLLDALTACVESQPALAELLLGVDAPEDGSCLVTVQQLLTVAQQPPQLLLAVYRLLLTLWQRRHRTALDKLRQDRNLWPIVCAPLAAGEDQFFLKIVSLVMRVMAEELHGDKHSPLIKTVNDAKLLNADRLALIYDKLSALLVSNVDLEQKKQVLTGVAELAGVLAADNSLKIVDASGRSQWVVLQSDLLARFAEHYSDEREFPIVASVGCVLLSVASAWGNDLKEDTWATVVDNFSSAWTLLLRSLPSYLVPKAVEFLVPVLNEAIKHADLMLTNDRWASAMFVLCETMEQLFVLHFGNSALQQRENSAQHCSALLHKATKVSVCVLKEMAGRSSVERRREVVLQQPICRSLVALLERQLANRALDGHFCALTADFIAVVLDVDSVQGLKVVESSNFLALVCIDLVTQLPSNSTLSPVQHTLLQRLFFVHSTGLVTLKHSFLHHALNFVGSYEQHIIH
uniref:Nucleoporin Nup188 N-terminal domain-containing protein n=1 Tax=Plectus sambesii TaxID=2011161 RepID=A0A914WKN8_9BILA